MVQFKLKPRGKRQNRRLDKLKESSQYWKLDNRSSLTNAVLQDQLKKSSYFFRLGAPKNRLLDLHSRRDRGLLSYEKYDSATVKEFYVKRNLHFGKHARRLNFTWVLENADDEITFGRFLDLPSEIRNQIYTLHFESFEPLTRPLPPPITTVYRQIRQETLMLFSQTCTVSISFTPKGLTLHTWGMRVLPKMQLWPHYSTQYLFRLVPKDLIGNVRKLHLTGVVHPPGYWVETSWDVTLGSGSQQVKIPIGKANCAEVDVPTGFNRARESEIEG